MKKADKERYIEAATKYAVKSLAEQIHRWCLKSESMPIPASEWMKQEDYAFDARWAVRDGVVFSVKGLQLTPDEETTQFILEATEMIWETLGKGQLDQEVFRALSWLRPPTAEVADHVLELYSRSLPSKKNRRKIAAG